MKKLIAVLVSLILIITLTGCETRDERDARLAAQREAEIAAEKMLISNYFTNSEGIGHYKVPYIELKIKKESFTLDIGEHIKNDMKAEHIDFPVSKEFYEGVSVGDELESKFNSGGLLFKGEISSYSVTVNEKGYRNFYFVIDLEKEQPIEEIDVNIYNKIVAESNKENTFIILETNENILWKATEERELPDMFSGYYKMQIESKKSNFTLDIGKHISNEMGVMDYEIEIPRFVGDQLNEGDALKKNFVGASLFFSSSPSSVTYTVKELTLVE